MAYYCDPHSYANTFYGAPFARRRPSPPPTTYYPRAAYDPYVRALAEEQAARTALQGAIQREREARQRRAEEEAKARIREQARREARARQRPQSFFGYPSGYDYPGYGYANYGDEDYDEDDYAYAPLFAAPRREPMRKQQPQPVPRSGRSQSRSPTHARQQSPAEPSTSPKVSIPITTPSEAARPQPTDEEKNGAATKIQSAYRVHAALSSINAARERFSSLLSAFSFPSALDFDTSSPLEENARPKLAYSARNAAVHAHEDALLRLLQTLDAVESHGDSRVRDARRELVREIEAELARVDAEVRRRWEEARLSVEGASAPGETDDTKDPVEAMDVEVEPSAAPEQAVEEAVTTIESKTDEMERSSEAAPAEEAKTNDAPEAMDVEVEPHLCSDQVAQEEATTAEEPIIEEPPSIESPAESEVETPPHVTLPSPTIHKPEVTEVKSEIEALLPVAPPTEAEPVRKTPEQTSVAAEAVAPESESGLESDAEIEEELVLVDAARPPSPSPPTPLAAEKDFVMV